MPNKNQTEWVNFVQKDSKGGDVAILGFFGENPTQEEFRNFEESVLSSAVILDTFSGTEN